MERQLGSLMLGSVPCVAAAVAPDELAAHDRTVRQHADAIELRLDRAPGHDVAAMIAACRRARRVERPIIATLRSAAEGGAVALAEDDRLAVYAAIMPLVDGVDIELHAPIRDAVLAAAAAQRKLAIVSYHDFAGTPDDADLAATWTAAAATSADIVKIAAYAASGVDTIRLLDLLCARRGRGMIAIAMGPYGAASRVFFPLAGSVITYGFADRAGAPGQLALAELDAELRRYSPDFAARAATRT
jgi:3-dehydroquinate dehydratase-1